MKGTFFNLLAVFMGLTAFLGWFNQKVVRLKGGLGVAMSGALLSFFAMLVGNTFPEAEALAKDILVGVNFQETVFHGMLCFMLFAGAMHIDLNGFLKWKSHILLLATAGVAISAIAIAGLGWLFAAALNVQVPFAILLVFGALLSPTDPTAVISLLKDLGASPDLEAKIASESLLNDGAAIVLFLAFVGLAQKGGNIGVIEMFSKFLSESGGGVVLGLGFGFLIHCMITGIDDAPTEVAITLAGAVCVFASAEALHVSAPLATAFSGIVVGAGSERSMSDRTHEKLWPFWEMLDEVLSMALFAMVGLLLMTLHFSWFALCAGGLAILCSLAGRAVSVGLPLLALHGSTPKGTAPAMIWGGLRGGLSLAMAMSLPPFEHRDTLIMATWSVVMFSLLVQATTMKPLLARLGLVGRIYEK